MLCVRQGAPVAAPLGRTRLSSVTLGSTRLDSAMFGRHRQARPDSALLGCPRQHLAGFGYARPSSASLAPTRLLQALDAQRPLPGAAAAPRCRLGLGFPGTGPRPERSRPKVLRPASVHAAESGLAEPWAACFGGIRLTGSQRSVPAAGNSLFPSAPGRCGWAWGRGVAPPLPPSEAGKLAAAFPRALAASSFWSCH